MSICSALSRSSNKAAKPEPAVVLSIADCCFVDRGDEDGDDDNDDELLIFAAAGLCMAVSAGLLHVVFFSLARVLVRSTMTMTSQPQWYTIFHYAWVGCNDDTLAVVLRTQY